VSCCCLSLSQIKRFIGRRFTDSTVKRDRELLPFSIVNQEGRPHVSVQPNPDVPAKVYSPEEVSAMVLTKMKEIAEAYLGEKVDHAVVTVPAYFNDAQRQATKDAGKIAGLNVVRIINEPTAAAIAYGLDRQNEDHAILVFDLGGGTFDVTVLTIDKGVFDVLSTNGDTHLGGEDFDQRVVEYYLKKIKSEHNVDISKNARALAKLRRAAEVAKRALSTEMSTSIDIDGILPDGEDFSDTLTRAKFEQLNDDLFQKTMAPVAQALKDSGLKKSEIAEVVLVGGSTKIPRVQEILSKFFDGKKLNKKVNPDEAVAYGAAVQAAILKGEDLKNANDVLVLDIAPLSLGMEVVGGVMLNFVKRNDKIPLRVTKTLTTEDDYQTSVPVTIFQGERPKAKDNVKLGHFDLGGIPPMKRGVPQIEVTFEVDEDSILHVSAIDTATKNTGAITISEDSSRLSAEEIQKMIDESELHAESDKAWRDRQDKASEVEHYVWEMKHALDSESVKAQIGGLVSRRAHTRTRTHSPFFPSLLVSQRDDFTFYHLSIELRSNSLEL
jgi:heat shock protein 5